MTICIAAIGWDGNNEKLIFATDHMITTGTGQFEQSITKYKEINSQTVVMLAGQTLLFGDLIKLDTNDLKSYDSIKGRIYRNFLDKRKEVIVNEILNIYGLSHVQLIDALQKPITNPFLQSIFEKVSNFRLNTSILLIGF
jgi:ATP-dependent protease HslVU (ClpYQ) peptidase subunit